MSGPIPLPNGNAHAGEITEEEWQRIVAREKADAEKLNWRNPFL